MKHINHPLYTLPARARMPLQLTWGMQGHAGACRGMPLQLAHLGAHKCSPAGQAGDKGPHRYVDLAGWGKKPLDSFVSHP